MENVCTRVVQAVHFEPIKWLSWVSSYSQNWWIIHGDVHAIYSSYMIFMHNICKPIIFWACSIIYGFVHELKIYIWLYWPSTRLVNQYMVYQAIYDTDIFADGGRTSKLSFFWHVLKSVWTRTFPFRLQNLHALPQLQQIRNALWSFRVSLPLSTLQCLLYTRSVACALAAGACTINVWTSRREYHVLRDRGHVARSYFLWL